MPNITYATVSVLSGYGKKAPAAILLEYGSKRILLDAGGGLQSGDEMGWRFPPGLDAIIISHDHVDHARGLEQLDYPVPVYATAPVLALLPNHLSLHTLPIKGDVTIEGIPFTVGQAGHSLGGIWIHAGIGGGIFYSGDYSLESSLFAFDPPPPAALALIDASYGLYDEPLAHTKDALLSLLERPEPVLLPVPPTGRALEIANWLWEQGRDNWSLGPDCLTPEQALALPHGCLKAEVLASLQAMPHSSYQPNAHIIISGDPDGLGGEVARLLKEEPDRTVIYTGYLPRKAKLDVSAGKAHSLRWNVHPRKQDLKWMVDHLQCTQCLPLFHPINNIQEWASCIGPSLVTQTHLRIFA